jgi:HEAT repeat protein
MMELHVGAKFDPDYILKQLGIKLDTLRAVEQIVTKRKVRAFYNARIENQKLERKLQQLEMIASGRLGLPEGFPILLKLYDDVTARTRILKVSSNHSTEELVEIAAQSCRRRAILNVQTSPTSVTALTADSLLKAHTSICRGEQANLMILAL